MNKYLLQILHDVNTIIIPGLGALTVTNSKTGEIMFMSFLKHEDGKLAKYISENDGISENDAKNLIAKYVREILAQLDKGDSYDMYQFGRFNKVNGEVEFENWDKYNSAETNTENVVIPAEIKVPKVEVELKDEPVLETEKEDIDLVYVDENNDSKVPNLDEILAKTESETIEINKAIVVLEETSPEKIEIIEPELEKIQVEEMIPIETKITESTINVATEQPALKKEIKPVPKLVKEKKEKIKTERKKKSKGFYLIIFLALFLVVGGALFAIFYDKIIASSELTSKTLIKLDSTDENLEEIENQVELSEEDSLEIAAKNELNSKIKEEEAIKEEAKKEKLNESVEQNVDGFNFHLISGGFGVEANAIRQAKKFQDEGKKACVLGKFDNIYLVASESFATKQEANSALKSGSIKGWIFEYRKK